ncbi:MAG: ABC transporter substrate-binding protein [Anaerolineae bacterium]|nr:ABC transporter substrate-binding protein [Anaerolineae bacterium]
MKRLIELLIVLVLVAGLSGTAVAQDAPTSANLTTGCVDKYDDTVDYFPDKVTVHYAKNFSVEYFKNYKVISMLPWTGATEKMQYVLVQCGTPAPTGFDGVPTFNIPIQRFVSMSTSILPHLTEQKLLDRLVGVDTTLYTSNAAVLELVKTGAVKEIGGGGTGGDINFETLLAQEPDLVMAQEFFAGGTTLSQLTTAGIPAVLNADYADTSPLGQAEWGKYVAIFFNTEAAANTIFDDVEMEYKALSDRAAKVETRPSVIAASPYDGTWYMPAGDSTIAQLIADAGGDFVFANETGTSVPLDVEVVLDRGGDAEFWVNINQFWATQADMLADDVRFASFRAVKEGNLWNNNARMNANGGSDYFESGAAHPEVILADLIKIFHPELLPDHTLVYYQRLAAK